MIKEFPTHIPETTVVIYYHPQSETYTLAIVCRGVVAPLHATFHSLASATMPARLVVDTISALHDLDLTPATL